MSTQSLDIARRISIQQQDYRESLFYVKRKLITKKKNENTPTLRSNYVAFMFDEMRYKLNVWRLIVFIDQIETLE